MAAIVWKTALAIISAVVVGGLLIDLGLLLCGQPTITAYLREQPAWYWLPTLLMIFLLIVLGIHLFVWMWPT